MPDAHVRIMNPNTRRATSTAPPHGVLGTIVAALGALHRWWVAGRHCHPERRYMRGGRRHGLRVSAQR